MQFLISAFLPVTALLATTAYAAECYSQHGSTTCLNENDLLTARSEYCNGNAWQSNNQITYYGKNGWRGTITGSNIPTQQLCWDSTLDVCTQHALVKMAHAQCDQGFSTSNIIQIINQCLGHKNGGSYSQNGWNVNIDFCA